MNGWMHGWVSGVDGFHFCCLSSYHVIFCWFVDMDTTYSRGGKEGGLEKIVDNVLFVNWGSHGWLVCGS